MAPVLSLLMALAMPALSLAAAIPQDDFHIDAAQIVGGTAAASGEFPYIVSLQTSSGSHFCGGSLLNANTVITAGHCAEGQTASRLRVRAGSLVSSLCCFLSWTYGPSPAQDSKFSRKASREQNNRSLEANAV
jgi:hypothetical protein